MITENGKVLAVEDHNVWVETLKTSTCGACRARHGCGQRMLAASDDYTRVRVALPAEYGNLQPGDEVTLGIDESSFLKGVFLAYGLPLVAMLVAVASAAQFFTEEWVLMLAAITGLIAGGAVVRLTASNMALNQCFRARLISRAENAIVQTLNMLD
ncbi:SoxR reducing system RseC family protein [Teredinibacter turnerae]|uniref:SoxR reducing system RseC family protein n=1 Tax=Teredinibacter turnerae TaxID=2426 RepID=UPI0003693EE1|nr:SoxR reducing system RseC family protein [Teredinibacter turnerae]